MTSLGVSIRSSYPTATSGGTYPSPPPTPPPRHEICTSRTIPCTCHEMLSFRSLPPVPCPKFPVPCPQFAAPVPQFPVPRSLSQGPCLQAAASSLPPCSLSAVPCPNFPVPSLLPPVPCPQFPVLVHLSSSFSLVPFPPVPPGSSLPTVSCPLRFPFPPFDRRP